MPKTIRLNNKDLRWCALVLFTLTCLPRGGRRRCRLSSIRRQARGGFCRFRREKSQSRGETENRAHGGA